MRTLRKIGVLCAVALACASFTSRADEVARFEDDADDEAAEVAVLAPKSAAEALNGMLSRLPVEPIRITGSLICRRQRGIVEKEVSFAMSLRWGATPAVAEYRLFDTFGRPLKSLSISRAADGRMSMSSADADGKADSTPSLADSIEETDVTWLDISLAYLWWQDAELEGEKDFRGVLCDTIIARPPEKIAGVSAIRLWIDRKRGFLRQTEQLGENGECIRRMWVSSVGKINDRWMVRNMEVKRPGTGLMTKLHVETLETP